MTETARPQRADARRNREQLLRAAVDAFSSTGPDVPLESVARAAGVGIGTLYRHFPSREALIEAAYRNEVDQLCAASAVLLAQMPADEALREWMNRLVAYTTTKRGMADALRMVVASGADPFAHSKSRLLSALDGLLTAGIAQGTIRSDVGAEDVLKGISGIALVVDDPEQVGRLLDLVTDGLRHRS